MSRTRSTVRRRISIAILTSATMLLTLAHAPVANAGRARELMEIVNETRRDHGLRALRMDRSLNPASRRHTNLMIRENEIFDPPNLAQILAGYDYDDLGADVVGCGHTLRELHRILMTESFHRMILLHPDIRRIGIGVVVNDRNNRCGRGSLWATEIMYG